MSPLAAEPAVLEKTFLTLAEARPGAMWRRHFQAGWPTPAEAREALARHMPELVPIYTVDAARNFATVYTAVYRPAEGVVDYVWPGRRWRQSFDRFETGSYTHHYAAVDAPEEPPRAPASPRPGLAVQ